MKKHRKQQLKKSRCRRQGSTRTRESLRNAAVYHGVKVNEFQAGLKNKSRVLQSSNFWCFFVAWFLASSWDKKNGLRNKVPGKKNSRCGQEGVGSCLPFKMIFFHSVQSQDDCVSPATLHGPKNHSGQKSRITWTYNRWNCFGGGPISLTHWMSRIISGLFNMFALIGQLCNWWNFGKNISWSRIPPSRHREGREFQL